MKVVSVCSVSQIKTFDSGFCCQNNVIRLELSQTRQRDILLSVRHTRWCLAFPRFRQLTSRYKLLLYQFCAEDLAPPLKYWRVPRK